jgi:hypothetical protein
MECLVAFALLGGVVMGSRHIAGITEDLLDDHPPG